MIRALLSIKKFRKETDPVRTPLNVSDFARVPFAQPGHAGHELREPLPPLENEL